tara:strand:- start:81 stop:1568 length:1488 start_codon:yes stop_codon:yes gene_type:complete
MSLLTTVINRLVERGAADNAKQILDQMFEQANKWKPSGYDTEMKRRRDYYEGKQGSWLRQALAQRYPSTFNDMSQVALNYAKLIADVDAAVYDHQPERKLTVDLQPLDDQDPVAKEYYRITSEAALNVALAECERRLMLMNTMFIHVRYDYNRNAPCLELFYPQDVWVIPDPANPTSLEDSYALMARVVSREGIQSGVQTYCIYYRSIEMTETGEKVKGPWKSEFVTEEGHVEQIYRDNLVPHGMLPFVIWRNGLADGTIYRDADNDLLDTIDAINVNFTNLTYVLDMQAHSMLAYEGDSRENLVGGPGKVISYAPGENLSVLDFNPKLKDMEGINNNLIKTLASTRRQSPDAYSIDQQPPESGVARQIANMPYIKALRERQFYAEEMEQSLYPLLVAVNNIYTDGAYIDSEKYALQWTAGEDPSFEDETSKTARIMMALDQGLISKERAAFELGYYASEEEARVAMAETAEAAASQINRTDQSITERLQLATGV